MFKRLSSAIGRKVDQQFEKYFPDTAQKEFSQSKWEWRWELGERSGYSVWRCLDEDESVPIHKPLPSPRHIRILQVECTADGDKKQFLGNLIPVSVEDPKIPYIAISYSWGNPDVFADIDFEYNRRLDITKSTYLILDTMLQKGNMLRLWIDSICINQKDFEEKTQQVNIMTEVYGKAKQVVICLGESNKETDKSMDAIFPLCRTVRVEYEAIERIGTLDYRSPKYETPVVEMWDKINILLSKSWFERIWVIQEVATAWDNPLLICGQRAVGWNVFCEAIDGYIVHHKSFQDENVEFNHLSSPIGLLNVLIMSSVRRIIQGGQKLPLEALLLHLSNFKATNSRDKIFTLLGLSQDDDGKIQPNYNTDPQQIYEIVTRYLLFDNSNIQVLSKAGVGYLTEPSNLPSWIPDFGKSDDDLYSGHYHLSAGFQAAGNSKPILHRGIPEKSIVIDGIKIDTISRLTSRCLVNDSTWLYQVEQLVQEAHRVPVAQLHGVLQSQRSKNQNWLHAVWLAMVNYEIEPDSINDRSFLGRSFHIWKTFIFENIYYHDFQNAEQAQALARHAEPRYKLPTPLSPELESFDRMCKLAANERRFFITASGLIGVTSPGTQTGDEVVVFLGAGTPFVIRKHEKDSFTLVGTAYVHGIMDGEAMGSEIRKFCLV